MLPRRWVSFAPQGIGHRKPFHYVDMLRVGWQNAGELPFAWRILRDGVCDGCALGTSGLRDWTLEGTHLCMVRLELLRLNTAGAMRADALDDVERLRSRSSAELRALGRLAHPMVRRAGERGFTRTSWTRAITHIASRLRGIAPERAAFFVTSRGLTNEAYYAIQKAARWYGTNHVDNSARLCHAASTVAMKSMLGHGASTCSYADWIGADLIVFFGSNTPNNQPVTTKYLYEALRRGAEVAVVNPYREPGLDRYWIPSTPDSALFGTRLTDHWFDVHTGGDLAFLTGVFKALDERLAIDLGFVGAHTSGFDDAVAVVRSATWDAIASESGTTRERIAAFAQLLVDRPNAIFVWSMGLTQHAHGVDTVRALINVALARGLVGRRYRGLMPIRGHSGVQGGAEVGCAPVVDAATRERWSRVWGFDVPAHHGLTSHEMVDAAARGALDAFWIVGGNFLETLAGEARLRAALHRPGLRVHHDIVVTTMMLEDPSDEVWILPATTRYESPGGGTETTTERRIVYSPEIPGRRVGEARAEWDVIGEVMAEIDPRREGQVRFGDAADIRAEIAQAQPLYAGIERLRQKGDQVQWGGRTLYADRAFATADARAAFAVVPLRGMSVSPGQFRLSTRRGKQFNSMVQRAVDPLTGFARDAVLMSEADATRLGLTEESPVTLQSPWGRFEATVRLAAILPGNLEVHWPEGNVLLPPDRVDPESQEPDYNAPVSVTRR